MTTHEDVAKAPNRVWAVSTQTTKKSPASSRRRFCFGIYDDESYSRRLTASFVFKIQKCKVTSITGIAYRPRSEIWKRSLEYLYVCRSRYEEMFSISPFHTHKHHDFFAWAEQFGYIRLILMEHNGPYFSRQGSARLLKSKCTFSQK